jgi:hypothetical protein
MNEALAREKDYTALADSILDAFRGEHAWRSGDLETAAKMGRRLLVQLPRESRLLRMRVQAWLADTLRQQSNVEGENLLHEVLDFYPTVLRQLNVPVPTSVRFHGPLGAIIADRLEDSPRIKVRQTSSFTVEIESDEKQVSICLIGGKRFGCAQVRVADLKEDQEIVSTALDAFHDEVFSPNLELSQSDITSLDGRTIRQGAHGALDALLGKEKSK